MEKYIVILVVILITYYLYKCWTDSGKEGFADAVSVDLSDDKNAINSLANMARDLMAGGFKVAGKLNVSDNLTTEKALYMGSGDGGFRIQSDGDFSCWRSNAGDNRICLHKTHGNTTTLQPNGQVDIGTMILKENIITGNNQLQLSTKAGDVSVNKVSGGSGNLNVEGNLNVTGNIVAQGSAKYQLRVLDKVNWDARVFLDNVVKDFSQKDPDGTARSYLMVGAAGQVSRYEYVKLGNRIFSFITYVPNGTFNYVVYPDPRTSTLPQNADLYIKSL